MPSPTIRAAMDRNSYRFSMAETETAECVEGADKRTEGTPVAVEMLLASIRL
jgi:hypothetical protein